MQAEIEEARTTWAEGEDPTRHPDAFVDRHLGPRPGDLELMLKEVGAGSLEALVDQAVPASIRMKGALGLPPVRSEAEAIADLRTLALKNTTRRACIGMGYSDCIVPAVIQRMVLENPGWYTQYTPYQAEIAQGRLEALLNFQTLILDLTAMECANSSLLDEATAAAEAMTLCHRTQRKNKSNTFFVSRDCHPQTIGVVQTRAEPLGIEVVVGDVADWDASATPIFAALVQYPATDGAIHDHEAFVQRLHAADAMAVFAADLLALTLLRPPGELGADVVIGCSQRFGVPLGYGGPHAAFMACRSAHKRQMPGRVVGVSKDVRGQPALRLALQTREQHIRRERATSNICTAQVLLAVMASMYAVYHGPDGLTRIARRVRRLTRSLGRTLANAGHVVGPAPWFDTLRVTPAGGQAGVLERAAAAGYALRVYEGGDVGIALDETTTPADVAALVAVVHGSVDGSASEIDPGDDAEYVGALERTSAFLEHPVFHRYRSETELLRYITRLQGRDLSLTHSMIPLGSCTMKLNAAAEMVPVTMSGFGALHPFAPREDAVGYTELFTNLEAWLAEITGFHAISLQPNAGSQGEYAGLLVIRAYHHARGDQGRTVCLIPKSAHGTNPASAVLAGMTVVVVGCDDEGNIDIPDLKAKAEKHASELAALMVTYPSTHGVFETGIREICEVVHEHGGQVYLDGANLNAMVGLSQPGKFGADVAHLNLHKTFCIPHGGGGPGMGPIGVAEHLAPFLPGHPVVPGVGGAQAIGPVSAAPWGSPSILPISYAYIAMMGAPGLLKATQVAILNANYLAARLAPYYPVLYTGANGRVAHECIIDVRPLKASAGVEVDDIAKRLMDYGFHAPTMSWPVAGTLMIEPTESESLEELDRFVAAMIAIREEVRAIEDGRADRDRNVLKGAPHTAAFLVSDTWEEPYGREAAAYPAPWLRENKFWPPVSRIDNAYGDRNLVCACPPLEDYEA